MIRLAKLLGILLILVIGVWFLMFQMPGQNYSGQLLPLQEEEITLQKSLQQDIQTIAVDLGIRNITHYENLNKTRNFLENSLTQAGYEVKRQTYKINDQSFYNLAVERLGTEHPEEIVLIGGHYDSAFSSPGANDNATGAAATLELAKLFAQKSAKRTIRFVEFTNEEPPFFQTENMGSF
ncbi:M28 family peptidase [Lusitaniella coriacea]|uniref:M28 family peptidase n=1 Tax=Lusitaniella coriacea TaxID=1983105 RepID=UPI003CF367FA